MSEAQREWLKSLASACVPTPPWTPAKTRARQSRDEVICNLYEQGVAVQDIADASSLSTHAISAVIKRQRAAGRRVVRPRARTAYNRESYRRTMTEDEVSNLRALDAVVPRQRNGRRFLWSPEGRELLSEVIRLRDDRVALSTLASILAVSRQAIHSMTRYSAQSMGISNVPETSPMS